jgi:hypothetical protein
VALADWQTALASEVVARASRSAGPAHAGLDPADRAWLTDVTGSAGFAVTCRVQRWWRTVRLRWAARLTLAALGERSAAVLDAYLDAVPAFTLFLIPEALRFLDFAPTAAVDVPHVRSVARFERALLAAKQAESEPAAVFEPVTVMFAAPPEELLAALLSGAPLPPEGEEHRVLVSPELPHRWRVES